VGNDGGVVVADYCQTDLLTHHFSPEQVKENVIEKLTCRHENYFHQ
jgi:hypothetical protein